MESTIADERRVVELIEELPALSTLGKYVGPSAPESLSGYGRSCKPRRRPIAPRLAWPATSLIWSA